MKKLFLAVFSLFMLTSCVGCQNSDDISKLSENLTQYEIVINLDCETKSATASETVLYVNNTDVVLKKIDFHLYPQFFKVGATEKVVASTHLNNAYPNGMDYAEFEVTRVAANGKDSPVVYSGENNGILEVDLPSSLLPNEITEIKIEFNFELPNCQHRLGYGEHTINLANFYPIACVFENGEFNTSPYNPNGDPFYSEMANYNITLNCNSNYVVAGTGEMCHESIEGTTKFVQFEAKLVRDFALILSDQFEVVSQKYKNTTVDYYYFDDLNPETSLKTGVNAISTFSKMFGEYPYSHFSIVKCDFVYGGMEYPNLVMISADVTDENDYKNVIVHETAHQWWYGMVGNDEFAYPWLDEALTEYSTILFYDNNDGYEFTHSQMVDSCKSNYTLFITVYQDVLGTINTSMRAVDKYETEPEYTYCTYVKGVLMFDSLYQLVGEKKFVAGCREYFKTFKYKNATPENLISSFEKATKQNLQNFFSSWVEGKVVIR